MAQLDLQLPEEILTKAAGRSVRQVLAYVASMRYSRWFASRMLRSSIKVVGEVLYVILDALGDAGWGQQLFGRVLANPVRIRQPSNNSYQQSVSCPARPARKQQILILFRLELSKLVFDILHQITSLEHEKFDWRFLVMRHQIARVEAFS